MAVSAKVPRSQPCRSVPVIPPRQGFGVPAWRPPLTRLQAGSFRARFLGAPDLRGSWPLLTPAATAGRPLALASASRSASRCASSAPQCSPTASQARAGKHCASQRPSSALSPGSATQSARQSGTAPLPPETARDGQRRPARPEKAWRERSRASCYDADFGRRIRVTVSPWRNR